MLRVRAAKKGARRRATGPTSPGWQTDPKIHLARGQRFSEGTASMHAPRYRTGPAAWCGQPTNQPLRGRGPRPARVGRGLLPPGSGGGALTAFHGEASWCGRSKNRTYNQWIKSPLLYQLSYAPGFQFSSSCSRRAPGGNRTPSPRLRRPMLYPVELQAHDRGDMMRRAIPAVKVWSGQIFQIRSRPVATRKATETYPLSVKKAMSRRLRSEGRTTACSQSRMAVITVMPSQ